jgi:hypothetical protein
VSTRNTDEDDVGSERCRLAGTLGVAPDIGASELRFHFKELAKIHHPDRGGDSDFMMVITEAYNQLINLDDGPGHDLIDAGGEGWEWADDPCLDIDGAGVVRTVLALIVLPLAALALIAMALWFVSTIR